MLLRLSCCVLPNPQVALEQLDKKGVRPCTVHSGHLVVSYLIKKIYIFQTFLRFVFDRLLHCVESHHSKGINHGKDHPDVNHLDIGSCGQGVGHTNESGKTNTAWCFFLETLTK